MSNKKVIKALHQVLSATPSPINPTADPAEIITQSEKIMKDREEALRRLSEVLVTEKQDRTPEVNAILEKIRQHYAEWQAALKRAQHIAGERLRSCRRIRQTRR